MFSTSESLQNPYIALSLSLNMPFDKKIGTPKEKPCLYDGFLVYMNTREAVISFESLICPFIIL